MQAHHVKFHSLCGVNCVIQVFNLVVSINPIGQNWAFEINGGRMRSNDLCTQKVGIHNLDSEASFSDANFYMKAFLLNKDNEPGSCNL